MTDLDAALEMIHAFEEVNEDPFAPYRASTDLTRQVTEHRCWGCNAVGESRWPEWKLQITHKPDCKWQAWRRVLNAHRDGWKGSHRFTTPDEAEAAGRAEYRRVTEGNG
jgi:hypothetical protein